MYRMLILLALLCAAPLAAHNATLRGSAMLTGETTHAGTSVTIEFDPLWGHQDAAALAITEKTRGKYPKAVVSGETTTDARGAFVLKAEFTFQGYPITNFEMETSAIYGLSRLLGHNALSTNAIIANRPAGAFSKDPYKAVEALIQDVLSLISSSPFF